MVSPYVDNVQLCGWIAIKAAKTHRRMKTKVNTLYAQSECIPSHVKLSYELTLKLFLHFHFIHNHLSLYLTDQTTFIESNLEL